VGKIAIELVPRGQRRMAILPTLVDICDTGQRAQRRAMIVSTAFTVRDVRVFAHPAAPAAYLRSWHMTICAAAHGREGGGRERRTAQVQSPVTFAR
jgi:hypothetical protein